MRRFWSIQNWLQLFMKLDFPFTRMITNHKVKKLLFLFVNKNNFLFYWHYNQGFSGRWLAESQSTWMHSFYDYVDDFVYFTTTICREYPKLPTFLVAHSMGCLIGAIGMARFDILLTLRLNFFFIYSLQLFRHPSLINRAVFSAPMFRNKCGMKYFNMMMPFPQSISYWVTYCSCKFGLGTMPTLGFFKVIFLSFAISIIIILKIILKEKPDDKITLKLTTDRYVAALTILFQI